MCYKARIISRYSHLHVHVLYVLIFVIFQENRDEKISSLPYAISTILNSLMVKTFIVHVLAKIGMSPLKDLRENV